MLNKRTRVTGQLMKVLNGVVVDLPTPMNITMWWNFGSLLGMVLITQIITGLLLAMHYTSDVTLAFSSVSHIVRDVNGGWFLRAAHANGASAFFVCLFAHVGRGLYYGSYSYKGTWTSGVILLIMVMASAFLGYVLPWGQMSYWGATVITNLFSAIPYFGDSLVTWLWGGFSVSNATLTRFFTFHFIIPLLVTATVVLHIFMLHSTGSNNPLGIRSTADKIPFHWYFSIKDLSGFVMMFFLLMSVILFNPNLLSEPDNFMMANPMSTPAHIVPEWYFLFAYAILRSIPNKLGGVVGLFASLLLLLTLPFLNKHLIKSSSFYPLGKINHWLFVMSFVMLTVGGGWVVEEPFVSTSQMITACYFSFFILHLPLRMINDKLLNL